MIEASISGKPESQEPSMEDILASIRRILAEDVAEPANATAAAVAPVPVQADDEADADEPRSASQHPPSAMQTAEFFEEPGLATEREAFPEPPPRSASRRPTIARDDVLVLSPEMRSAGHTLVSAQTAEDSTDVLSHLARAILDRRDIAVTSRDVTLEGMVREMLRPLLREWLDRNLPYLIERLVKKEIDLMINRAERLED